MSISTAPPSAPPKKTGWGCCGLGCAFLVVLAILFLGLIGGLGYTVYANAYKLTSSEPSVMPASNVGDDVYMAARQKLADFDHDVKNHQATTIQLSADEINVLIARNPDAIKNNLRVFVSFNNNEGRLQASLPTDTLSHGVVTGRYANVDTSFEVSFDLPTRSVILTLHTLQFGKEALLKPDSENDPTARSLLLWYTAVFNQAFNASIRKNPDGAALLDQAKSIEIKDGDLVISTQ
jgi:hypothetical protein